MGNVIRGSEALKVVLDHHVSSDGLGAEFFKNAEAEATGRLVVEAANALGVPLTPRFHGGLRRARRGHGLVSILLGFG